MDGEISILLFKSYANPPQLYWKIDFLKSHHRQYEDMQNSFIQFTPKKKKSTYNLVFSMINELKSKSRPPSISSMCIAFKLGIDLF